MKIVIFGCQQIAVDIIGGLVKRKDVEIPLIVTYELPLDQTYGYESVLKRAKELGLNVENPKRVTESIINKVEAIQPDYIFSIYYRKILPKKILDLAKKDAINIHPSFLPDYRGPCPTAWAIKNGEKQFGITIHKMDEGIDTGDILVQKMYDIFEEETGFELYSRGMTLGVDLFTRYIDDIVSGKLRSQKQTGVGSYFGKFDGKATIDWKQRAEDIKNMVRVHAKPYNPAETILFNRYVLVNKVSVIKNEKYILQGVGKILDFIDGNKPVVSCSDGCVVFEDFEIVPYISEEEKKIYLKIGNKFG